MARWRLLFVLFAGLAPVSTAGALAAAGGEARTSSPKAAKGAVKLVTPRGRPLPGPWQGWARRALMPTVIGRVRMWLRRCPALPRAAGCVYTKRPRTIFVRPGLNDPRGVLLHELGHVYDMTVLNNRDRRAFRRILRRRAARWWGADALAEQFAEAYSWCARYARIVSIAKYSSYDYQPTGRQHRRICKLVRAAAGDRRAAQKPPQVPAVTRPHDPPPPPPSDAPGVVPGDPDRDPGAAKPTPTPTARPVVPLPTPTGTPPPLPPLLP